MNIDSTDVSDEKWALIVEDEELNKRYIAKFLEKNGYKYKWAKNVKKAFECIEEAIKLNQSIEVIFLDIYLEPDDDKNDLTGVDFLKKRKELGLNDIGQVIVMTGNEEIHIVQECNKYDIQNYIKKPVSESNLVYEMSKIDNYIKQKKCPFDGYETKTSIGRGATGEVFLVFNKQTKKKYAMKKLLGGTKETIIHNRLKSPNILEFIDSKMIDKYNYMLLEYAENGTLSDWIQNKKILKNEKKIPYQINTEQILLWITELFLGLFTTHDKNLIHRDIKTDNLFLCENDVLKIGDLGIAKAIEKSAFTVCGTHHYMAPEIHKNKEYDSKADVWAAGIVLYELIMLEKPFDGDNEEIVKQIEAFDFIKIPDNVDIRLKKLIEYMLIPDQKLRYSSKEILNLDFIKETIDLIEKKNLFQIDEDIKARIENISNQENLKEDKEKEIYKNIIYKEAYANFNIAAKIDFICPYKTSYKKGYFSSVIENCVKGSDLAITIEELGLKDVIISEMIEKLIKADLINNVTNDDVEFDENNMYKFNLYENPNIDNSLLTKNTIEDHNEKTKKPLILTKECLDIALYLWKKIQQLYNSDDIFTKKTEFVSSKEYFEFLTTIIYLKHLQFDKMSKAEKLANILNIYQTMLIHYFIKMIIFSDYVFSSNDGMISKVSSLITGNKNKGFNVTYNIGGNIMNLYELKNITIRRNKKPIDAYMRLASSGDCREQLIDEKSNNTLLLVCIDPPTESIEDIGFNFAFKVFSESVYTELESFKKEWIMENTKISEEEISLPYYLKSYLVDFNNNEEDLIKFLTTNMDEKIKSSTLIRNFRNKSLVLDYCK